MDVLAEKGIVCMGMCSYSLTLLSRHFDGGERTRQDLVA